MRLSKMTLFTVLLVITGLSACNSLHANNNHRKDIPPEDCVSIDGTLPPGAVDRGNCGYKYMYARGDAFDLGPAPARSPVIPRGGADKGDVYIRAFAPPLAESMQAPMSGVLFVVKSRAEAIFNAGTNINIDPSSVDYDSALGSIPLSGKYPRVICVMTEEQLFKKMVFPEDMPANFNKRGAVWIK